MDIQPKNPVWQAGYRAGLESRCYRIPPTITRKSDMYIAGFKHGMKNSNFAVHCNWAALGIRSK